MRSTQWLFWPWRGGVGVVLAFEQYNLNNASFKCEYVCYCGNGVDANTGCQKRMYLYILTHASQTSRKSRFSKFQSCMRVQGGWICLCDVQML